MEGHEIWYIAMRFMVFMSVKMWIVVFWVVMCSLASISNLEMEAICSSEMLLTTD
jgi:hypothetical protein